MALITCQECRGTVSTTAATCPHCGAPVPPIESAGPAATRQVPPLPSPAPTEPPQEKKTGSDGPGCLTLIVVLVAGWGMLELAGGLWIDQSAFGPELAAKLGIKQAAEPQLNWDGLKAAFWTCVVAYLAIAGITGIYRRIRRKKQ